MGFSSTTNGGYIDLTSSTDPDTYQYRARELDKDGKPVYEADGKTIKYKDGSYQSALAAALAENGVIEAADGDATIIKSKDTTDPKTISIEDMCDAIYRNDSSARAFIDNIDYAIDNVSLRCTKIGAYMNRLDSAIEATDVQRENLTEAVSTIKDADAATESSNYIRYQILQQATASLLATANQQPQIALNLL